MPDWFQTAYNEFERPLLRYVTSLTRDPNASQDVVQDAFVKMHRLGDPAPGKSPGPWLFRVCRNAAVDLLRRSAKEVSLEVLPEPEVEPEVSSEEELQWLRRAISALPAKQREVVRLKYDHDMRYEEISQVTGLSVSNVGFLLSTALGRLRDARRQMTHTFHNTEETR